MRQFDAANLAACRTFGRRNAFPSRRWHILVIDFAARTGHETHTVGDAWGLLAAHEQFIDWCFGALARNQLLCVTVWVRGQLTINL